MREHLDSAAKNLRLAEEARLQRRDRRQIARLTAAVNDLVAVVQQLVQRSERTP